MPTEAESVCCTENGKVWAMVKQYVFDKEQDCQCITLHPGFRDVCLSEYTLAAAYSNYRREFGRIPGSRSLYEYVTI